MKYAWRALTIITVSIFIWLACSLGFMDLAQFPSKYYSLRWKSYHSVNDLLPFWGMKSFNESQWQQKVDRAPQATDLAVSNKMIGLTKSEVEKILGSSDGHYALSENNLSYEVLNNVNSQSQIGAAWSFVLFTSNGKVSHVRFYKACCEN